MKADLTYALNHEGVLVHIDSVPKGNNCGCICPACKKPLQAKNAGKLRKHHFAHQIGVDCPTAFETVLHLLAKERIQKAFYAQTAFNIEFEYRYHCKKEKSCVYVRYDNCETAERRRFNLKEYYDTCEQETAYDNINRRSDLKIWSTVHPDRKPIYIEIFVTHQSDESKLHSGNKIIEIKIENEQDIDEIVQNGFVEKPRDMTTLSENVAVTKTHFFGFKKEDYCNKMLNQPIDFCRYVLYPSGKFRCYQDTCLCNELCRTEPRAQCELCFHTIDSFNVRELAKWMGYQRYGIKNCLLCRNYVDSYDGMGKLCRLYKHLGFSRYEQHDTARAKTCPSFTLYKQEMEESLKELHSCDCPTITEL